MAETKFTVEAVPAPVVMGLDDDLPGAEPDASIARSGGTSKQAMWRDELIKTGIRGKGGAMLRLADLEVIPGTKVLHASGSLADSGERVVVSFGPEHAALEQRQVELAVQEADKLVPKVKMVVFCAFTFDPEAAKDIDEIEWPGVVGDSTWEGYAANVFEGSSKVRAYAKNDHLGFEVSYLWNGSRRRYVPDFLVSDHYGRTIVVELKGQRTPQSDAKHRAMAEWVAAVNEDQRFGVWSWAVAYSPEYVHDIVASW